MDYLYSAAKQRSRSALWPSFALALICGSGVVTALAEAVTRLSPKVTKITMGGFKGDVGCYAASVAGSSSLAEPRKQLTDFGGDCSRCRHHEEEPFLWSVSRR